MPLLGTRVELSAFASSEAAFLTASNAAFERVTQIHAAMSFHQSSSDLRAIARSPSHSAVTVEPDTWHTLAMALEMESVSEGAFNAAVAPTLVRRGLLPRPSDAIAPQASSLCEGIVLDDDFTVHIVMPVWIDLGGIAKGRAVDEAVRALTRHGMDAGLVNAGGDLRAFGPQPLPLAIRHPANPAQSVLVAELTELSCATSAAYFSSPIDTPPADPNHHPAMVGSCSPQVASVSVIANSCMIADALTKVVWFGGRSATPVLRRYDAQAVVLDRLGHASRL